jgi:hypothetical protein
MRHACLARRVYSLVKLHHEVYTGVVPLALLLSYGGECVDVGEVDGELGRFWLMKI